MVRSPLHGVNPLHEGHAHTMQPIPHRLSPAETAEQRYSHEDPKSQLTGSGKAVRLRFQSSELAADLMRWRHKLTNAVSFARV